MSAAGETNDSKGVWVGRPTTEPKFERREIYEVCGELAKRLGVEDEYTDGGKTREDWVHELYDEFREKNPKAPTWAEMLEKGIYKESFEPDNEVDPFILDPEANPLKTETGKIQIYSPELAKLAKEWDLKDGDEIYPVPVYVPGYEGPGTETDEYPLSLCGYHTKAHTHSSYANNEIIRDAHRHNVLINPIDAEARGIANNDKVRVKSRHGEVEIEARVTNRVIPGTVMIPEGSWHKADMQGDRVDKGGNLNTLTTRRANPISKQTGQHNALVQVVKA